MNKLLSSIAAISLAVGMSAVNATPITGEVYFGGTANVDFGTNTFTPNNPVLITAASGDLAGVAASATWSSFVYTETPGALVVSPLFSFGNFSFNLTKLTYVSEDAANSDLDLRGVGYFSNAVDGFTDTTGGFSLSTDASGGTKISFSASAVPEPGMALLLASGLVAVGVAKRGRKKAA